uniref:Uncharacterized protein n=1 Tax=Setaria italica TaxID=4555 RepID=K3ZBL2_SETIT
MEKLRTRAARAEQEIEEMRSEAEKFGELMGRLFDVLGRGMRVFGALARDVVIISLGYILVKNV